MKKFWLSIVLLCSVCCIDYIETKTFSINKAIEEELAQRRKTESTQTDTTQESNKKTSDKEKLVLESPTLKKLLNKKSLKDILGIKKKKIIPLKYRKLFQLQLPNKPVYKTRSKRKRQSIKRDTNNGRFDQKLPLLRRLSMLLDNVITSDSVERDHESVTSAERDTLLCPCAKSTAPHQKEETAASAASAVSAHLPVPAKVAAEAPRPPTHHPTNGNIRSLRKNKKLSLLPARDTARHQRNDHGISQGSRASRHRSVKGDLTRHNGTREHNPERKRQGTSQSYVASADDVARNGPSRYRTFRRKITSRNRTSKKELPLPEIYERKETDNTATTHYSREARGNLDEPKVENKLEVTGDKEEHTELFRGRPPIPTYNEYRTRVDVSEDKISNITKSLQSNEDNEKSYFDVQQHLPSNQRVLDGNGAVTKENKRPRRENETVISLNRSDLSSLQNLPINKSVVVIIDGYSVTRNKAGENRLSEKTIRQFQHGM